MRKEIHPKYMDCAVKCVCGNTFVTRATIPSISLDICSACHPFFTGSQKFVDAAGRVERFVKKFGGDYFKKPSSKASAKAGA
ncbi:MAG: 50S ribosomal protein L31 [Planctomycetes bacterium]|nr:50S ribosomal protein L31 [Planctomycetota bacterium]